LQYEYKAVRHRLVLETDNPDPPFVEILCSPLVKVSALFSEVSSTVQFDREPEFRTIKVDNVRTYADLSPELLACKLASLKVLPKKGFH